jgi:DNA-binding HxlR family transcriptional regulator
MNTIVSLILNTGVELVGKKWRAVIIWHLKDGPMRFSEIKRLTPEISVKVLSEVLKEMQNNELVVRTQYDTIPVKVTYEIHQDAIPFIDANLAGVVSIGHYIVKHHVRMEVSDDDLATLKLWLLAYPLST